LDYDSALAADDREVLHAVRRLIQRDYSNGGFYNYYFPGGLAADKSAQTNSAKRTGEPYRHGRAVYGGGGISPDEVVKPGLISAASDTCATCCLPFHSSSPVQSSGF
jgi:hypothetical protein